MSCIDRRSCHVIRWQHERIRYLLHIKNDLFALVAVIAPGAFFCQLKKYFSLTGEIFLANWREIFSQLEKKKALKGNKKGTE